MDIKALIIHADKFVERKLCFIWIECCLSILFLMTMLLREQVTTFLKKREINIWK